MLPEDILPLLSEDLGKGTEHMPWGCQVLCSESMEPRLYLLTYSTFLEVGIYDALRATWHLTVRLHLSAIGPLLPGLFRCATEEERKRLREILDNPELGW